MKNFRGSALAAGVGTPESVPHELLGSSLRFYLVFKHRNCFPFSIVVPLPGDSGLRHTAQDQSLQSLDFHIFGRILHKCRHKFPDLAVKH